MCFSSRKNPEDDIIPARRIRVPRDGGHYVRESVRRRPGIGEDNIDIESVTTRNSEDSPRPAGNVRSRGSSSDTSTSSPGPASLEDPVPRILLHDPRSSNTNNARSSHWRMTLSQNINSGFTGTEHRSPVREGREGIVQLGAVGRTKAGNAVVPNDLAEAMRRSEDERRASVTPSLRGGCRRSESMGSG